MSRIKKRNLSKWEVEPVFSFSFFSFFRAGLIEAWGRGTLKIMEECRKVNLPSPVFSSDSSGFGIKFKGGLGKMSGKMSGKTSGKILAHIKEDTKITIPELSEKIGLTERTIERNLQKLQEENLLKRVGGAKGGHWEVVEY